MYNILIVDDFNERGAYGVRELWQDAMHHPGCAQLKYLKDLMESVDFINGKADDSLLLFGQKERYHRISVFAGEDYILCYDYMGDEFLLDLRRFQNMALDESENIRFGKTVWEATKVVAVFSFMIEFTQLLFHLGTFQISDLTYNTLGGAVGGVIYYLGYCRKGKRKNKIRNRG